MKLMNFLLKLQLEEKLTNTTMIINTKYIKKKEKIKSKSGKQRKSLMLLCMSIT